MEKEGCGCSYTVTAGDPGDRVDVTAVRRTEGAQACVRVGKWEGEKKGKLLG